MPKTASLPTHATAIQPVTRNPVYRFRSRHLAESFRAHAVKSLWLMLGDHDGEDGARRVRIRLIWQLAQTRKFTLTTS